MVKLKVTFEIDVQPMNLAELKACGMGEEEAQQFVDEGLEEYDPDEIADCLVGVLNNEDSVREGFGGSEIFVTVSDAKLIDAELDE